MNKKSVNVLIIDDHPIIIEAVINTLQYMQDQSDKLCFKTESARDCETAHQKIQSYSIAKPLDLIILDLSLPPAPQLNLHSGDDLGVCIRGQFPNTKILVITSYTNSHRIRQTINAYNPLGFLNKQDVGFTNYMIAINKVLLGETHYSKTIINAIKQKSLNNIQLDTYDFIILKELANGSNMRDLLKLVHLSKSAIDKRKRLLKRKFNIDSNSDRDLVLAAKAKGFI
ncbi:two-component system response regulator [Winogradskyella psychrotolerans RS-3]|uniref:Two-component system response regulator n=1 Tax=Winogradskyella psychrotolerans RS-3 TaxID=641526 RepID=S7X1Y0_9FLAO|nr:response regulator [Winogradskyella psychrotolerans]EPR73029.1 two-component system response regulator [Winogradskyella psychrotolerans RS-3]